MTGLLFEALISYYEWFDDPRIVDSMAGAVDWLWDNGWNNNGFNYQIGCEADTGYPTPDLNLMIAHGFAFAWYHSREARHLTRGLDAFHNGVAEAWLGARKHYNQNFRSSGAFLWYATAP